MLPNIGDRQKANDIIDRAKQLDRTSDAELRDRALDLKWRTRSGASPTSLLSETFALAIVATDRALGCRQYPVQIFGAISLFRGRIAEMHTGEGKTLTAVPVVALRAFSGKGVHVVTANEYLARRDAEQLAPIYERLGLSTGFVGQTMNDSERRTQYDRDITYATASEIGFDFLRDRLKTDRNSETGSSGHRVQREHHFALIDEADSVLIDEARTPLVIGVDQSTSETVRCLYHWGKSAAADLNADRDYVFDAGKQKAILTPSGSRMILSVSKPQLLTAFTTERLLKTVEKSITVQIAYQRGREYLVSDGEVVIIDEGTGRQLAGRKWQDGIHQAIEAKEDLELTAETSSAARMSVQSLFRRYEFLAGMTGTARQVASEFKRVYKLSVRAIPTRLPCKRIALPPRIFSTLAEKFNAIADSVQELVASRRAVLIGTPSVLSSQQLAQRLAEMGIDHFVLNATKHAEESQIVATAGQVGRVTIATNMAGRGTDIPLSTEVRENGGLHIIPTEMHTSQRIDRQLIGRAARQGEPGSYQFFLSCEDELLRNVNDKTRQRWLERAQLCGDSELQQSWLRVFKKIQRSVERSQELQRHKLLRYEKWRTKQLDQAGLDPYLDAQQ